LRVNILLQQTSHSNTVTFYQLIVSCDLTQLINGIAHHVVDSLYVVCIHNDQPLPVVDVHDTDQLTIYRFVGSLVYCVCNAVFRVGWMLLYIISLGVDETSTSCPGH